MILVSHILLALDKQAYTVMIGTFSDFWNGQLDPHFPRIEGPFLNRDIWNQVLPWVGFNGTDIMPDHFAESRQAGIIIATAAAPDPVPTAGLVHNAITVVSICPLGRDLSNLISNLQVYRKSPSTFVSGFCAHLMASGYSVDLICLSSNSALLYKRVIFLTEIDHPLFTDIESSEWEGFKHLALSSRSALWVTRGGLIDGRSPEYAIINGLARALQAETKTSRFVTVDLDQGNTKDQDEFDTLIRLEERAVSYSPGDDSEFRLKSGVVYIPRLQGDEVLNQATLSNTINQETTEMIPLGEARRLPVSLAIDETNSPPSVSFQEDETHLCPLDAESIEIEIRAAGISRKVRLQVVTDNLLFSEAYLTVAAS